MEDEKKKRGPKPQPEVYITASYIKTSKGPAHHGDRVKLPPEEAAELIRRGWAQ